MVNTVKSNCKSTSLSHRITQNTKKEGTKLSIKDQLEAEQKIKRDLMINVGLPIRCCRVEN